MDATNRTLRRSQLGQALAGWASGPQMRHEVGLGWWVTLTGAPSADVNLALVHDADPRAMQCTVDAVEAAGCPTLVMFAGSGRGSAGRLGRGWSRVADRPFMAMALHAGTGRDARGRRADAADAATLTALVSDAFDLAPEAAGLVVGAVRDPEAGMRAWLLEDCGRAVSCVLTSRVGDAVTVWYLATPRRFAGHAYGRALLTEVLAREAAAGARLGLLSATASGRPSFETAGWHTLEQWTVYTQVRRTVADTQAAAVGSFA